MASRIVDVVAGVGTAIMLSVASTVHAQDSWSGPELPVRVFDLTGQHAEKRRAALEIAAGVLADAGVRIVWTVCGSAGGVVTDCSASLKHNERVIRVNQRSPTVRNQEHAVMGDAVVDRRIQSGVLATIYADRVWSMASRAAVDNAVLLGRAIAHELGHLLLGGSHSSTGIMRSRWTVNEIRWDRPDDWRFTNAQVATLAVLR